MDLRQILGQGAHFQFEQNVFQGAAAGLDAQGFAHAVHRNGEDHFFVFSDFVQINMEQLVGKDVVLNLLDDGQAVGLGVALDGEIEQDVFGGGAVNDVADVLEIDFQFLGLVELP